MTRLLFISVFMFCLANPARTFADTVDVWTVKLNGKEIINSNEVAIGMNHPMKINLASFKGSDSLQICFRTDSFLEVFNKWYYLLKDTNNAVLAKFAPPLKSTSQEMFVEKKYVSFSVQDLKVLLDTKHLIKMVVEVQFEDPELGKGYLNKPVCIISKYWPSDFIYQ